MDHAKENAFGCHLGRYLPSRAWTAHQQYFVFSCAILPDTSAQYVGGDPVHELQKPTVAPMYVKFPPKMTTRLENKAREAEAEGPGCTMDGEVLEGQSG